MQKLVRWIGNGLGLVRFGARSLLRSPGFTLTGVASLEASMALAVAAMVVGNGYLVRSLPYRPPTATIT